MDSRRGVTLIELLIVLVILAALTAAGGGLVSGQVATLRARASIEALAAALAAARDLARSTGDPAVRCGVALLRGRWVGGEEVAGWSYLRYGVGHAGRGSAALARLSAAPVLPLSVAAQPESVRGAAVALGPGIDVVRAHVPDGSAAPIPAGVLLEFDASGQLDVSRSGIATLATEPNASPLPFDDSYTFDLVEPACGWMRLRVARTGLVQLSGLNALDAAAPDLDGGGF